MKCTQQAAQGEYTKRYVGDDPCLAFAAIDVLSNRHGVRGLTLTFTGRGERMRASGPVERYVRPSI